MLVERRHFDVGAEPDGTAIGGFAPVSISISVVLPAPFGPTMPIRSPRCTRIEKSSTIGDRHRSGDVPGFDDQLAGLVGFGGGEVGVAGGAAIVRAVRAAHRDCRAA